MIINTILIYMTRDCIYFELYIYIKYIRYIDNLNKVMKYSSLPSYLYLGGIVVIVMRTEYMDYVDMYKEKLRPRIKQLIDEGCWKPVS